MLLQCGPYRQQRGFTLLELMLVVLIIGLMVATVRLSLPDRADQQLNKLASRLHAQIKLASQQAVFQNQDLALLLAPDRYAFYQLDGDSWRLLEPQAQFAAAPLSQPVQFQLTMEGGPVELDATLDAALHTTRQPQILFFSDGQMTDFELTLSFDSSDNTERQSIILRGNIVGDTTLTASGKPQ